jgi:hypothetical protein
MQISAEKKAQANKKATPLPILMKDMCKIGPNPLPTKRTNLHLKSPLVIINLIT